MLNGSFNDFKAPPGHITMSAIDHDYDGNSVIIETAAFEPLLEGARQTPGNKRKEMFEVAVRVLLSATNATPYEDIPVSENKLIDLCRNGSYQHGWIGRRRTVTGKQHHQNVLRMTGREDAS